MLQTATGLPTVALDFGAAAASPVAKTKRTKTAARAFLIFLVSFFVFMLINTCEIYAKNRFIMQIK